MLLDEALPRWDRREVHRIVASGVPAATLLDAVEGLTWREVPLFKALMTLRFLTRSTLSQSAPVLDWFISAGFRPMCRTSEELLFVATQSLSRGRQSEPPDTLGSFHDYAEPGCIKMAINFAAVDGFLMTETRVLCTDAGARRRFTVYWLAIRAGSGVIRRVWLRAVRSRARAMTAARPQTSSSTRRLTVEESERR